jgi:hypothetical protein
MSEFIRPPDQIAAANNLICRQVEQISFHRIEGEWAWSSYPSQKDLLIDLISKFSELTPADLLTPLAHKLGKQDKMLAVFETEYCNNFAHFKFKDFDDLPPVANIDQSLIVYIPKPEQLP